MAKQMNLQITPEFERELELVMRDRNVASKSEMLRVLARDAAAEIESRRERMREWLASVREVAGVPSLPIEDDDLWGGGPFRKHD